MPILAPFEIIAMEKGLQQGLQQGWQEGKQEGWQEGIKLGEQQGRQTGEMYEAQATLIEILEERFGLLTKAMKDSVWKLNDISHVRHLRKQALKVESLQDFNRLMQQ